MLILDVTLPGYNAVELLGDLQKNNFIMPLVLFSGWRKDVLEDVARLAEAFGFTVGAIYEKPVDGRKLLETLI